MAISLRVLTQHRSHRQNNFPIAIRMEGWGKVTKDEDALKPCFCHFRSNLQRGQTDCKVQMCKVKFSSYIPWQPRFTKTDFCGPLGYLGVNGNNLTTAFLFPLGALFPQCSVRTSFRTWVPDLPSLCRVVQGNHRRRADDFTCFGGIAP